MRNDPNGENVDHEKPAITLPAVVEKIVKPFNPERTRKSADSYTRGRPFV